MPTTVEEDLAASTSTYRERRTPPDRAPRTLFVTNAFQPRLGGAQSYYWGVIRTLDPSEVAILAPAHIDAAAFDATHPYTCLLYTSDAADDLLCVDLGGRRIITKKIQ